MRPSLPPALKADCSACVGLCCVVPPFDAVQGFGFDKPAETACRHLGADHRCGIHACLIDQGFAGCAAFDCFGAGQRLTAMATERLGSSDWRSRPEVAAWLFAAYPRVRQAQEWLAQLRLAAAAAPALTALQPLAEALEASRDDWPQWDAAEQQAWRARVRDALAPLQGGGRA